MTDRDPFEESVLSAARRAHEPSAADAARVLQRTRHAIAADVALGDAQLGTASHGALTQALVAKLIAGGLVIAALSGGIGYQLGLHAEDARAPERAPRATAASSAAPPAVKAAPAIEAAPAEASAPEPSSPVAEPAARTDAGARRASKPRGPHLEPPVDESVAVEESALPLGSLDAEVRALERIQRALRDREPQAALALLQQLDRDVPAGRLIEERSAARALARCELGHGEPLKHALEFSQRFPASVYFARVRKTCMDASKR